LLWQYGEGTDTNNTRVVGGWLDCGFQQGATIIKQTATAMHELNTLIHSLHRVNIGVAALVYGVGHDMS
jgi:hypothetical protein